MSNTSYLHHVYQIRGFKHVSTQYVGDDVLFHIRHADSHIRCPECRTAGVVKNGTRKRTFRLPPAGHRRLSVTLPVQRVVCRQCHFDGQLPVPFAEQGASYSKGFARYARDLLRFGTIDHVAKHLGVGWDMIKDIHKADLKKRFDKPSLKSLSAIAIDEFYAGPKTKYYTFVLDIKSGAVVYVGKGKGSEALEGFWKCLAPYKDNIAAVAMDLSPAFISAVRANLPNADLVFDPFHVMKLMNDKLDQLRRELWNNAPAESRVFIKNSRWILLKGCENLSEKPNPKHDNKTERQRLDDALAYNQPLAAAYYLKEALRLLWKQPGKLTGKAYLESWMAKAEASGIEQMAKMAESLRRHQDGILAYFDHRITSGPMEAVNAKVRVMQRQTYGLRDQEFFALKVKSLHECSARLVGAR